MDKLELKDEEITYEKMEEILNGLFYTIRGLKGKTDKDSRILADCLDGCPEGVIGVQMLMGHLTGSLYDLVTRQDGTREYVKRPPVDPKEIYIKTNELIDFINTIDLEEHNEKVTDKMDYEEHNEKVTDKMDYEVTSRDLAEISKERGVGNKILRKIKEFFDKIRNHDTDIGSR